jgi:hypothetical protein
MVTRPQRLNDFDSDGQPPIGELMELLCEDHNVLPFPCRWVDGVGGASGPIIRLMPPLLGGVGNEDREGQDKTRS